MSTTQASVASAANVVLGLLLGGLAILLTKERAEKPGRLFSGLYLALVGANYLLDGSAKLLNGHAPIDEALRYAALVPVFLDPPMLLLASLALTGRRLTRFRCAAALLPGAVLCALFLFGPPPTPFMHFWSPKVAYVLLLGAHYSLAFGLIALAYIRQTDLKLQNRDAIYTLTLGVIVLPRLVLLTYDLGMGPHGYTLLAVSQHLMGLAGILALTAYGLLAFTPPEQRPHVRRTLGRLGGLIAAIGGFWTLILMPQLKDAAFVFLFSSRWFMVGAILTLGTQHYDVLEIPQKRARWIQRGFILAILGLAGAMAAAILSELPGATVPNAALQGIGLVVVVVTLWHAFRHAVPLPPGELFWRRHAVYRAHVELGKPPEELERLQVALGIPPTESKKIHRLVEVEQRVGQQRTAHPRIGEAFLGRYVVERVIGAGAFGRTFAAWDTVQGERVVLKELHPEWEFEHGSLEAFRREARAALEVSHPNLVGFRGLEATANGHVLVLEHVEGKTLRTLLSRGPLPPQRVAALARDLLAGLCALHQAGLLHRDVKPENVIIRPDGRAVLLDLGAASSSARATVNIADVQRAGTPGYASPEQRDGHPDLSPASDLYSLGVLLWESLTGAKPPTGNPPTPWDTVLARALRPLPQDRWPNAQAFANAIPQATHRLSGGRSASHTYE